uniref:Uncharacterized protein n=1 Tax=Siphoviridae sp. ctoic9 TaxID=2825671 RepID=A0A8S5Q9Y2_9CAUD|nr:MAG TPA: hypothetical protein [Siphoviridae sp. ctoic9]
MHPRHYRGKDRDNIPQSQRNERQKPRARFSTNNGANFKNSTKVWKLSRPAKRATKPPT